MSGYRKITATPYTGARAILETGGYIGTGVASSGWVFDLGGRPGTFHDYRFELTLAILEYFTKLVALSPDAADMLTGDGFTVSFDVERQAAGVIAKAAAR